MYNKKAEVLAVKTNQNEIEYFEALRAANYNLIQKTQKLFEDLCDPSSIENYFLISFYNPDINMPYYNFK